MIRAESLNNERPCHQPGSRISRAWAFLARFMAGANAGGSSRRSTKRRWSSIESRMMLASSIVLCAASWAAATTKSLMLRPCNSAALHHRQGIGGNPRFNSCVRPFSLAIMEPPSPIRELYGILPDSVHGIPAGSGEVRCHEEEGARDRFLDTGARAMR